MSVDTALDELALSRPVGEDEVTQAYRRMTKRFHPDKAANPDERLWAQKKFVRIQAAYDLLKGLSVEEINGAETVEKAKRGMEPPNVADSHWPDQDIADWGGDALPENGCRRERSVDWPMLFLCLFATFVVASTIYYVDYTYMGDGKAEAIGTAILGSPVPFCLSGYFYISVMCRRESRRRRESKAMR